MRGATPLPGCRRLRRRLGLSTALGTGLLLGVTPAQAQTLPVESDIVSAVNSAANTAATIDKSFGADAVSIGLHDVATVINWTHFDIPAGKSIGFTDATATPGTVGLSVLNRVIGSDSVTPGTFVVPQSRIDGQLNAASNISVYLINSSGILFGPGSVVNVGGLIASSQALRDADFFTGQLRFRPEDAQGQALTGGGIEVKAGATLRATGDRTLGRSDLILVGASVAVDAPSGSDPAATLTAQTGTAAADTDGDVGVIVAEDVTITSAPGSPLALTITKGTNVSGAFKVNGTISGRNVTLALATRDAVADTLLSIDGMVTATGVTVTDRGVVLSADRAVTGAVAHLPDDPADIGAVASADIGASVTSGGSIVTATAGTIAARGALNTAGAGDVTILSGGAATLAGSVTAGSDYIVSGASITIGKAGETVEQSAVGRVDLTATTGGIVAAGTPRITSNSANAAFSPVNRGLFLDAVNGGIDLSGSSLFAGTDTTGYSLQIRNNAADPTKLGALTLGDVTAHGITLAGTVRIATQGTTASFDGGVTTGALTLAAADFTIAGSAAIGSLHAISGDAAITTTGTGHGVTIGAIAADAGGVSISAAGALGFASLAASGQATLDGASIASGGTIGSASLSATAATNATLTGAITTTAGDATITATSGTLTVSSIDSAGGITLGAPGTAGDALIGALSTTAGNATIAAGRLASVIGDLAIHGDYAVSGTSVVLGGDQSATGAITITAGQSITAGGAGSLAANADGLDDEALTLNLTDAAPSVTPVLDLLSGGGLAIHANASAASAFRIGLASSDVAILLGSVEAGRLQSRIGTSGPWIDGLTSTSTSGIRAGDITLSGGPLLLNTPNGALETGRLTAPTITLSAYRILAGDITATAGSITIDGRGGDVAAGILTASAATGDIIVDASGGTESLGLLGLTAGRDVLIGQTGAFANAFTLASAGTAGRDFKLTSNGSASFSATITAGRDIALGGYDGLQLTSLSAGGTVTLASDLGDISGNALNARSVAIDAGRALQLGTLTTTAGDASLLARGGDAIISGAVTVAGGAYQISGQSVRLGTSGSAIVQKASGAVTIEAQGGTLVGQSGLTLQSDSGGAGNLALTLLTGGTSGGDIFFAGTTLLGGSARQSDVRIGSRIAGNGVALGDVAAANLLGASGGATFGVGIVRNAAITIGNVDLSGALTLQASGDILTAGTLSARSVTLSSGSTGSAAPMSAVSITAQAGAVTIVGNGALTVSGAITADGSGLGDISIDRTGALAIGSLSAQRDLLIGQSAAATSLTIAGASDAGRNLAITSSGAQGYGGLVRGAGNVSLRGGTLALGGGVTATTGALALTALTGNLSVPTLSAGAGASLTAANGTASVTGAVSLTGDYSVTGSSVILGTAGTTIVQQAQGAITITATGGTLTGLSGLTLHADTNGDGNQALSLVTSGTNGGDIAFGSVTLRAGNGTHGSPIQIRSRLATNNVALGDLSGGSLLGAVGNAAFTTGITRSAAITLGDVTLGINALSGTDSSLRISSGSGTIATGALSTTGAVLLASNGATAIETISAGGVVQISGSGALTIAGAIAAAGGITIDRGGTIALASLTAQGDIAIGQSTAPASLSLSGGITSGAGGIAIRSSGGQVYGAALSARNAVRIAGASVQATDIVSGTNLIDIATSGATTVGTLTSATSATITAGSVATVSGAVAAGGAYSVTGASVLLGNGAVPILQRAESILAVATSGVISGGAGLTLRSDLTATGAGTLILDGAGGIALDSAARLEGGADGTGDIGVRAGDGQAIALGVVKARTLTGVDSLHALTASLATSGTLSFGGTVTTLRTLDASAVGALTTERIDVTGAGQDLRLAASGTAGDLIALGPLNAAGALTLGAARTLRFTSATAIAGAASAMAGGALSGQSLTGGTTATATAGGSLTLTTLSGQTGASARGASVALGSAASAEGLLSLVATAGDVVTPGAMSAGAILLRASGDIAIDQATAGAGSDLIIAAATNVRGTAAGTLASLSAGRDIIITASGQVNLAEAEAGRDITIEGGALSLGQTTATTGSASLTANGGDATIGMLLTGAAAHITADGGAATIASLTAGGDTTIHAGSIVLPLARIGGGAELTSVAGGILASDLIAGSAMIAANGTATLGQIEASSGALVAGSQGALSATTLIAQGDGSISGATLDIGTATSGGALGLTTTAGLLRITQASGVAGLSILSAGAAQIGTAMASGGTGDLALAATTLRGLTPDTGAILSAGRDLTVNISGAALLGQVTAGGAASLGAAALDLAVLDAGQATILARSAAARIGGITAGGSVTITASAGDAIVATIGAGGAVSLDAATIDATNVLAGGALTARSRAGALDIASFTATGDATLSSATDMMIDRGASLAGGIAIDAGGTLVAGNLAAATLLRTNAATSTIGSARGDRVDITARSGALRLTDATAATSLILTKRGTTGGLAGSGPLIVTAASGDATIDSSTTIALASLTAGRDARLMATGAITAATLQATGNVIASGAALTIGTIAGGTFNAAAGPGGAGLGTATIVGDVTIASAANLSIDTLVTTNGALALGATNGFVRATRLDASGDMAISGATLDLATISAGGTITAIAGGGGGTLRSISAAGNVSVASAAGLTIDTIASSGGALAVTAEAGDLVLGNGSAATSARLAASNMARVTQLQTTGDAGISGSGLDLATATIGGALNATAGTGGATIGTIRTAGDATITAAASLVIDTIASANGALTLTATAGGLTLGDGTAGTTARLTAGGAARVSKLQVAGDAMVSGNALDLAGVTTGGTIEAIAGLGSAKLGTIAAAGDVAIASAAGLTATALTSAAGTLILTANGGDIVLGNGNAGSTARLAASGTVRVAKLEASGDVIASGRALDFDIVTTRGALDATAGADGGTLGMIAVARDATITSSAGLTIGTLASSGGALALAAAGGDIVLGDGGAGTIARLTASGTVRASRINAGSDIIVRGDGLDLATLTAGGLLSAAAGAGGATFGTVSTAGDAAVNSAAGLAIGTFASSGGAITLAAADQLSADMLASARAISVAAHRITLGTVRSGASFAAATQPATAAIRTTALSIATPTDAAADGTLQIDTLSARDDVTLTTAGDLVIASVTSTSGSVTLGDAARISVALASAARDLTISAGTVSVGSATAGGAILATATSGDIGFASLGASSVMLSAAGTATVSGAARTAGDYSIAAAAIMLGDPGGAATTQNAGGRVTLTARTGAITGQAGLGLSSGSSGIAMTATGTGGAIRFAPATINAGGTGNVAIEAAGAAMLGGVTGRAITISAADVALEGAMAGDSITLTNRTPANPTRLGDAPAEAATEFNAGDTGFSLSNAEIARLSAASLVIDAQGGAVRTGDLSLTPAAGSTLFQIRTSGRVDVLGRFVASGSPLTRLIVLGGGASDEGRASILRVATTAANGGRLLVDGATLDLRADSIGVGLDGGFLDAIGIRGAAPIAAADVASRFVSQPNSSLYNATLGNAQGIYSDPLTVQAGRLIVRYANFALFQNSGQPGTQSGLVIGTEGQSQSLQLLPSAGTNAFAMFGKINNIGSTATSLLGGNMLVIGGEVSRSNSRANGCLIGAAGGGCLSASIVQPTLSVFDTSRAAIFRTGDDLTLPFDPSVGTSNEALFSDISSVP
ncbi:filamentous hemagglutinin N-terminal domain-containing protein [Sphingomonas sp.]|uniref:two-partner secretion domain-containing protein n=1 Tax=Sphingomonas sp. TaxID=28214 RepID=UPI000DB72698|nr:filamentous hemagglutinin N-terminal domain-containing protein [Sphingomonas sp.]PZU10122.1 MAG: hypothetical protein DI605_05865 [Sphingomonas sp.]